MVVGERFVPDHKSYDNNDVVQHCVESRTSEGNDMKAHLFSPAEVCRADAPARHDQDDAGGRGRAAVHDRPHAPR